MAAEDVRSSVVFVFDEGLSDKMAGMLTHCGGKTNPKIEVQTLKSRKLLSTPDPEWIAKVAEKGWCPVSQDTSMINDHDIATLAISTGAKIFLLCPEISQQKSWGLMQWYMNHLQKIARATLRVQPGTAWLIGRDGGLHSIKPACDRISAPRHKRA